MWRSRFGVQSRLEEVALGLRSRRPQVLGVGQPRWSLGIAVCHHGGWAPALGTHVAGRVRVSVAITGTGAVVDLTLAPLGSVGVELVRPWVSKDLP